jgi:hypothetical protein
LFYPTIGLAAWIYAGIVAAIFIKSVPVQGIKALSSDGQDAGFGASAAGFYVNHDVSHADILTVFLVCV